MQLFSAIYADNMAVNLRKTIAWGGFVTIAVDGCGGSRAVLAADFISGDWGARTGSASGGARGDCGVRGAGEFSCGGAGAGRGGAADADRSRLCGSEQSAPAVAVRRGRCGGGDAESSGGGAADPGDQFGDSGARGDRGLDGGECGGTAGRGGPDSGRDGQLRDALPDQRFRGETRNSMGLRGGGGELRDHDAGGAGADGVLAVRVSGA